jgi:hypothetical protein
VVRNPKTPGEMKQEYPQTQEEKIVMYMKCSKRQLVGMVIECNNVLDALNSLADQVVNKYGHFDIKGTMKYIETERAKNKDRTEPDKTRYLLCNDQPAQIDCRDGTCRFNAGAGKCTNVSPAITINSNSTCTCWSRIAI